MADTTGGAEAQNSATQLQADEVDTSVQEPKIKKSRTNTPWTPAEELRLKQMRDAGNSWSEIAKVCNCDCLLVVVVEILQPCRELSSSPADLIADLPAANRRER